MFSITQFAVCSLSKSTVVHVRSFSSTCIWQKISYKAARSVRENVDFYYSFMVHAQKLVLPVFSTVGSFVNDETTIHFKEMLIVGDSEKIKSL